MQVIGWSLQQCAYENFGVCEDMQRKNTDVRSCRSRDGTVCGSLYVPHMLIYPSTYTTGKDTVEVTAVKS